MQAQNERQAAETAEKEQRQAGQKAKKAAKEALEAEWRMLGDHQEAIEAWKAECDRLKAQNVHAKDLPAKPKHPLKPKPNLEVVGILISLDSKMNAVELVKLAQHQEIVST